jgi:hypothetical protein
MCDEIEKIAQEYITKYIDILVTSHQTDIDRLKLSVYRADGFIESSRKNCINIYITKIKRSRFDSVNEHIANFKNKPYSDQQHVSMTSYEKRIIDTTIEYITKKQDGSSTC